MKQLYPYIAFSGDCAQALEFYCKALKGEAAPVMKFSEMPEFATEENKDRIMHSEFRAEGVVFMAADEMRPKEEWSGSRVSLSINFDSEEEQASAFNALAEGGTITMPLQNTFWGAIFGILIDRFGITWMFNYDKPAV